MWPGISSFPDYKSSFPKWPRQNLQKIVKSLDTLGINLLEVCPNVIVILSIIILFYSKCFVMNHVNVLQLLKDCITHSSLSNSNFNDRDKCE